MTGASTYPGRVLRTALKPRWLGLLGVVVLVGIAFVQLGRWQLGVAHDKARAEAVASAGSVAPVALSTLLAPHTSFPGDASGRLVTATGRYAAGQVLVAGRLLNGASGYWLVTPLTVQGGGTFPVVRGWTPTPVAPPPPAQAITVTASLAPGEAPSTGVHPAGQLGSVDLARAAFRRHNTWPGDLFNAFGFAQGEKVYEGGAEVSPGGGAEVSPGALTRVPPPMPETGLNVRNAGYALQWWVFAAFGAYMWVRMVREAARADADGSGGARSEPSQDQRTQEHPIQEQE